MADRKVRKGSANSAPGSGDALLHDHQCLREQMKMLQAVFVSRLAELNALRRESAQLRERLLSR